MVGSRAGWLLDGVSLRDCSDRTTAERELRLPLIIPNHPAPFAIDRDISQGLVMPCYPVYIRCPMPGRLASELTERTGARAPTRLTADIYRSACAQSPKSNLDCRSLPQCLCPEPEIQLRLPKPTAVPVSGATRSLHHRGREGGEMFALNATAKAKQEVDR